MALRDQPYLPLYVQDFMTDEKLAECSAEATGVYIRIMCLMHKSETYGRILLKQKYKQTGNQISDFALMIAKNLPYDLIVVERALTELLAEKVLRFDGEFIVQKRMVKDAEISDKRAIAGKKGGKKTQSKDLKFASNFGEAKIKANTEYENEYENENEDELDKGGVGEKEITEMEVSATIEYCILTMQRRYTPARVHELWKAFNIHSEKVVHRHRGERLQHFRNWIKIQKNDDTTKITGAGRPDHKLSAI